MCPVLNISNIPRCYPQQRTMETWRWNLQKHKSDVFFALLSLSLSFLLLQSLIVRRNELFHCTWPCPSNMTIRCHRRFKVYGEAFSLCHNLKSNSFRLVSETTTIMNLVCLSPNIIYMGFPIDHKESVCNAIKPGFDPWIGKIPGKEYNRISIFAWEFHGHQAW